ncbi:RluA family pseudouridine synthase [Cuneatibacter sp. NSJ-177]|uniref:RluA family pseudouridine synthase n=1 Tax=Cuneatibacter sp. NSJ-177 TaxID=2931401 RepID=UPI001FD58DD5|nr:RluA family pseudouridine synthase [Cuneatibacter sp. NSJ-177]MCJ7836447.1 RluA family pseudouridine synthase [Cuneatibacter sp. NSJ-177]
MSADQLIADEAAAGCRLDAWLSDNFEELSRSYLQKLIRDGNVLIGDKPVKSNYRLKGGEQISLELPEPEPLDVEPEPIPLDIVYEDSDLLFVNKPKGMVVHPAPGHPRGTLVNGLLYHCGTELSGINGVQRPGIVHRIDRDTTGLLVVCKNDFSHSHVAKQLAEHTITRRYRAIVHGVIEEEEGTVNQPIGRSRTNRLKMAVDPVHGKQAVTHYRVLKRFSHYTYIECRLETGRTHQIRAHMTYLQHPLLGDPLYGARKSPYSLEGQTLHAGVLGLIHPRTGEYLEREAPLPEYFQKLLEILP